MSHKSMLEQIPDWMIIDSVRYAIGRMTYQVGITTSWLVSNWRFVPQYIKDIIVTDVEREFKADDMARDVGYEERPLGHDCDRQSWERVRALWKKGN